MNHIDGIFELVFVGGVDQDYRRWHWNYDQAVNEAANVLSSIENRAAHPAIIYGPELGKDGRTIP